jgi:hypothetical protein
MRLMDPRLIKNGAEKTGRTGIAPDPGFLEPSTAAFWSAVAIAVVGALICLVKLG